MPRKAASPRLSVEVTHDQRHAVKVRAAEHGYEAYGGFVTDCALEGVLLPPQIRRLLSKRAAANSRSYRDEVEALIVAGLEAQLADEAPDG